MSTFTHYTHDHTDFHDVDEELMSISAQGGHCGDDKYWSHTEAGIAMRHQGYTPTEVFDVVASKKIIYLLPYRKEAYSYIFNI